MKHGPKSTDGIKLGKDPMRCISVDSGQFTIKRCVLLHLGSESADGIKLDKDHIECTSVDSDPDLQLMGAFYCISGQSQLMV